MTLKYLSLEAYIKWKQNKLVHKSLECWLLEVVEHFIKNHEAVDKCRERFQSIYICFLIEIIESFIKILPVACVWCSNNTPSRTRNYA